MKKIDPNAAYDAAVAVLQIGVSAWEPDSGQNSAQGSAAKTSAFFVIERAQDPRDPWSGHLGFPGGMREECDEDALATCLRELAEETGIVLSRAQACATLPLGHAGRAFGQKIRVQPFLFQLEELPAVTLQASEAADYHLLPEAVLRDPRSGESFELAGAPRACLRIEGKVLWGFTYKTLLDHLGVPWPTHLEQRPVGD